ncbi:uncharacterized protein LOC120340137 [Styela clava]
MLLFTIAMADFDTQDILAVVRESDRNDENLHVATPGKPPSALHRKGYSLPEESWLEKCQLLENWIQISMEMRAIVLVLLLAVVLISFAEATSEPTTKEIRLQKLKRFWYNHLKWRRKWMQQNPAPKDSLDEILTTFDDDSDELAYQDTMAEKLQKIFEDIYE